MKQVLIAEDSPIYRKLVSDHLADWGFGVTVAKDGLEAWTLLQRADCPRLVLLDWVLPDVDGVELCRRIRREASNRAYTYVILLTGKDKRQDMLDAMQAGADDYLVKPFDALELRARLMVGKRIIELQEELVAARDSMRYAATHDALTGLMNRAEILDALKRELERARRDKKPVSIILADIDHFKKVNDTFGHLFGDEALREVATGLRSKLRVYDSVGRYGGEEFLLILPNCDLMNSLIRADELRAYVGSKAIIYSGARATVTVSMGVAVALTDSINDEETLLQLADQGLYAAKQNGRNRVEHVEVKTASDK